MPPNPDVPVSTKETLDQAFSAARAAFKVWSMTALEEWKAALLAYADALDVNSDNFIKVLTMEQGKPLEQAAKEVGFASAWIRGTTNLELPQATLVETEHLKVVQPYTPLGVVGAIVPWNYPILLAIAKVATALFTGNVVIIKPSPYTPYSGLK